MELAVSPNEPKVSLPNLDYKNNCYVVPSGGRFHYFPIKIDEATEDRPTMRFAVTPPILLDGIVMYKRKMYKVRSRDILRGMVLKCLEIVPAKRENNGNTSTSNSTPQVGVAQTSNSDLSSFVKSGVDDFIELEDGKDANSAWEEQVESLLGYVSSKEGGEWEIKDPAFSGRLDESGPVQNTDSNSRES